MTPKETTTHAESTPPVLTIEEFCERYRIERGLLFRMRRDGRGPDVLQLGRRVLITLEAAREWEVRMTRRGEASNGTLPA
ncbi:hypothetical protein QF000_006970 [Paraburkholderia atlantica]|uniref:hypothetical protein n=1 Tax=Paraburkholderia atlantica TaxID=2654982 RepID=UPI003D1FBDF2